MKNNNIVILNSYNVYDTIVYNGVVIGFGANETAQSVQDAFLDSINSFVEVAVDLIGEYGENVLYDKNIGLGTAFISSTVGYDFIESLCETSNGLSINQYALVDAFSSGFGFENYIKGKVGELITTDYSQTFLSYVATINLSSISAEARLGKLYVLTEYDDSIKMTLSDGTKVTYSEWFKLYGNPKSVVFSAGYLPENAVLFDIDMLVDNTINYFNVEVLKNNSGNEGTINELIEWITTQIIEGTNENDFLSADRTDIKPARIYGKDGNDTIYGYEANDVLFGDNGDDYLYGNYGNDILYGGSGDDGILGQYGKDILFGGSGNDSLYGYEDIDFLIGGDGDDRIYGGNGNDFLFGKKDDVINGVVDGVKSKVSFDGIADKLGGLFGAK